MISRKVCVVTGTRAEYGLLRLVMEGIKADPEMELQVIATGMHLSPEFGLTYLEIEADGFTIDRKIEMLLSSDTSVGVTKSMGLGMISFAEAFAELRPDLVLVLGDRFETFVAASAALVARIPVGHLHGGELTEGAIDDAMRHAISKFSSLHFVAAHTYRDRVLQLGESPESIHVVGGLGLDAIERCPLLNKVELEHVLDFKFRNRNFLVAFHPATVDETPPINQFRELLEALDETATDAGIIFTMPNADAGGRALIRETELFVSTRSDRTKAFKSLGQRNFYSCLRIVDAIVGNSSSGLLEAPSFGIATVDIGSRQRGRLIAQSVVRCEPQCSAIIHALSVTNTPEFKAQLRSISNPYGEPGASQRIVNIVRQASLKNLQRKTFHDLSLVASV